ILCHERTLPGDPPPMSLSLIQIILGSSFLVIWLFITAMILRDGLFAIRDEEESRLFRVDAGHRRAAAPHTKFGGRGRSKRDRSQPSAA
ncbi:MAG: hypothetical protein AB7U97_26925, partial [Pirellulales bacterium]